MNPLSILLISALCATAAQAVGVVNATVLENFKARVDQSTTQERRMLLRRANTEIDETKALLKRPRLSPQQRTQLENKLATYLAGRAYLVEAMKASSPNMAAATNDQIEDVSFLDNLKSKLAKATPEAKQRLLTRAETVRDRLENRLESGNLKPAQKKIAEKRKAIAEQAIVLIKESLPSGKIAAATNGDTQAAAEPLTSGCRTCDSGCSSWDINWKGCSNCA